MAAIVVDVDQMLQPGKETSHHQATPRQNHVLNTADSIDYENADLPKSEFPFCVEKQIPPFDPDLKYVYDDSGSLHE